MTARHLPQDLDVAACVAAQLAAERQNLDDVAERQAAKVQAVPVGAGNVGPELAENPLEFLDLLGGQLTPRLARARA